MEELRGFRRSVAITRIEYVYLRPLIIRRSVSDRFPSMPLFRTPVLAATVYPRHRYGEHLPVYCSTIEADSAEVLELAPRQH